MASATGRCGRTMPNVSTAVSAADAPWLSRCVGAALKGEKPLSATLWEALRKAHPRVQRLGVGELVSAGCWLVGGVTVL